MKCRNCGKDLLDTRQKFCSINCQEEYIENLEERIRIISKNDTTHTVRMSQ